MNDTTAAHFARHDRLPLKRLELEALQRKTIQAWFVRSGASARVPVIGLCCA